MDTEINSCLNLQPLLFLKKSWILQYIISRLSAWDKAKMTSRFLVNYNLNFCQLYNTNTDQAHEVQHKIRSEKPYIIKSIFFNSVFNDTHQKLLLGQPRPREFAMQSTLSKHALLCECQWTLSQTGATKKRLVSTFSFDILCFIITVNK